MRERKKIPGSRLSLAGKTLIERFRWILFSFLFFDEENVLFLFWGFATGGGAYYSIRYSSAKLVVGFVSRRCIRL